MPPIKHSVIFCFILLIQLMTAIMLFIEDVLYRGDDCMDFQEVPIMSDHPICKFPDTLDGVQLKALSGH